MTERNQRGRPDVVEPLPRLVLVVHDVGGTGGMEQAHAELIRRLVGRWQITVVSRTLDPDLRPLVGWRPVRWVPSRPIPAKFAAFFVSGGLALRSSLRSTGIAVVHACGAIVPNRVDLVSVHLCHAGFVRATGRLAPRPAPPLRRLNTGLQRLLALGAERWCYRPGRLRQAHAVSAGVGKELEQCYAGVPVAVVANGVETDRLRPDRCERARLRAEHATPEEALVGLFVGGDWDRKGLAPAIAALGRVRAGGIDARLWVVGGGDRRRFARLAERAGVGGQVVFFGPRPDATPYYQAADVLVLPSEYETFSLVAHEAAACGLPVVATAVHGVVNLVGPDQAGLIVGRDPDQLAAALLRLADSPELRMGLGAEGRRRVAAMTWEAAAEGLHAVLEQMILPADGTGKRAGH